MKRDDWKFILALAVTLFLAGAVVYRGRLRAPVTAGGEKVDLPRIEALAGEGVLSLHPADYWAPAEEPR